MINNFVACCGFSLLQEGGFCNVVGDPGGATNHGVTMATLSVYLGRPATVDDVKALTDVQAVAIYKPLYWAPENGDGLPEGVDLVTLDFAITAGPGTSARLLQRVLGVAADGFIGPATLTAAAAKGRNTLIVALTAARETYYRGCRGFAEFGAGWLARSERCRTAALGMVA